MIFTPVCVPFFNVPALADCCATERFDIETLLIKHRVRDKIECALFAYVAATEGIESFAELRVIVDKFCLHYPDALQMTMSVIPLETPTEQRIHQQLCPHGRLTTLPAKAWLGWCEKLCRKGNDRETLVVGNQLVHTINDIGCGVLLRPYEQESESPTDPFTLTRR